MDSVYLMIIVGILSVIIGYFVGRIFTKKEVAQAEELAKKVLDEAKKEAETIKKEAKLEAKSQMLKLQSEMEKKYKRKEEEFSKKENRLAQKEENLDRKSANLDKKEENLQRLERELKDKEIKLDIELKKTDQMLVELKDSLQRVANMTEEEAKEELKNKVIDEAKREAAKRIKEIEEETKEEADKIAKKIIAVAVQRYSGEYVSESTVSVVDLPNDEMKGRIIGREGRNIRSIEAATGVDVIIDDTPEAVIISGHDPVRREVARLSLTKLVADGRIHPARIEEVVNNAKKEIDKTILEMGQKAIFDLGIHKMHPELVKLIGRLKYRTSYAQNIYVHSMEVAFITGIMAAELGLNEKIAKRAGLLHDIGKAVDHEVEGPHAKIGADLAKKFGERPEVVKAIGQHHDDSPETVLGVLVQAADALSAARPGARKEMLENYIKRMQDLENIATNFNGVQKAYAIQAGRELRVIVQSDRITDEESVVLSMDIAKAFEEKLNYPGQIKITVIRETRAIAFAR